jgi:hypothetical protein
MLAINVVQMAMIEVIDMVLMANGGVATAWAMNMRTCTSRLISAGHWGVPFLFGCVLAASRLRNRSYSEEQYIADGSTITPEARLEFRLSMV